MSLDVNISEPDEFNCIELHSCITEIAKLKDIQDFEYHVDHISGKGENYIANIFRVLIKERDKENTKLSVIVKTLVNTTRQELFRELHNREVAVYKDVIPKFISIQDCLDVKERVMLPECLFSRTEKNNEILILEDLLVNGFEMDDKLSNFENIDFEQVGLVMKELAKFHALTFALERKDPEGFIEIKAKFKDIIFQEIFLNKSKLRNYFSESFEMSLKVISNGDALKKLKQIEPRLLHTLRKFMEPRKHNVLCHGDCWINNVMFKQEENEQSQICFLDFQAMRYASPVTDIIMFLYICTDSKFRSDHFDDLQNIYYESMKSFLELHEIDVKEIYPRDEFVKDIKDLLPFGLLIALIELRIVTTNPDEVKGTNIEHGTILEIPDDTNFFKLRVNDVVQEFVENGFLYRLVSEINV